MVFFDFGCALFSPFRKCGHLLSFTSQKQFCPFKSRLIGCSEKRANKRENYIIVSFVGIRQKEKAVITGIYRDVN